MYDLDKKRSQWAWEKENHCLRDEVEQIGPMWRRKCGGKGVDANTMLMETVGFHFILSSCVRINLENDIRGALEYDQFGCPQTVLAVCERNPCL